MTLREEIQARIAKLDDAVLPAVLLDLEAIELDLEAIEARQSREFSQEFTDLMNREPRPDDLSGDEAMRLATEAVKAHRQEHRR
jgi:hypothetical protein